MERIPKKTQIKRSKAGLGLYALEPIKKGAFIVEYTGKKIPTKVADELTTKYLFEINRTWTIDGSPRSNRARYINHSCAPNAESDVIKGQVLIFAIKNIAIGEEITFDYGEEYFDEFIKPMGCRCAKCAKSVAA